MDLISLHHCGSTSQSFIAQYSYICSRARSLFPSTSESLSLLKLPLESTRAPTRHLCQASAPCSHLCGIMWSILSQPIRSAPTFSSVFFFFLPTSDTVLLYSIPPVSAQALFLKSAADLTCPWLPVWFGSSCRHCGHVHFL